MDQGQFAEPDKYSEVVRLKIRERVYTNLLTLPVFLKEPPPSRTNFPPPETSVDDEDNCFNSPSGQVVLDVLCRFPEARAAALEGLNQLRKRSRRGLNGLPDPPVAENN